MSLSRAFLCVLALLSLVLPARAGDERAIEAYRRGDLAAARGEWLALLDDPVNAPRGAERGRILYDLGNTAFREGQTLEAVGWYTAALRLRPRDADTWTNLEEARSRAKLAPADRGDLQSTLARIVRSFTRSEGRWLAFGGLVVLALALVLEAFRGGRLARWFAGAAALVACLSFVPCIDHELRAGRREALVVASEGCPVRSEPREQAPTTADLPPGALVEHVDELPDWIKVRLPGGLTGWVARGALFGLQR